MQESPEDIRKRNEEEVRRILKERGLETSEQKPAKIEEEKSEFSLFKSIVIAIFILLVGGAIAYPLLNKQPESKPEDNNYSYDENDWQITAFQDCLDMAEGTDYYYDDASKYLGEMTKYQGRLNCYAMYPGMASEQELNLAQQKAQEYLAKYGEALNKKFDSNSDYNSISSYTELKNSLNQTYESAQNKYRDRLKELEEESRVNLGKEESENRDESIAIQQRMEAERKQKEAEDKAAFCSEYRRETNSKTPKELAEEKDLVKQAYNTYKSAADKVENCSNQNANSNRVLNSEQRKACLEKQAKQQEAANRYFESYQNELNTWLIYYQEEEKIHCGQ